jgi:two-component system, NtrC family, sensor kinase
VKEKKFRTIRPKRSLRTLLMVWFLLLSIVPLMFVTGYAVAKYQETSDNDIVQRLRSNSREYGSTMGEFEKFLVNRRARILADPLVSAALLNGSTAQLREHVQAFVRSSPIGITTTVFNSEGDVVVSYIKDDATGARQNTNLENANVGLSNNLVESLNKSESMVYADPLNGGGVDLVSAARIDGKNGRVAGFVEETISIGTGFLENYRRQHNLDVVIFSQAGDVIASSQPDFLLYKKGSFAKTVTGGAEVFFDLPMRDEPFKFISTPAKFGSTPLIVALGASKQQAKAFIKNVNLAFFTMVLAIGVLLVLTAIIATRLLVKPVYQLVEAVQTIDNKDGPAEIAITSSTEFGVLQESFNEMSRRIYAAKTELENKVREVEAAYSELKETQARLVHTAKMAGLGQLVAGIAHELNNPIGFIYSNMSHLSDYSGRLVKIIREVEADPTRLAQAKAENDFDYIVEDLPRLISSCEEGARRTRDIVVGLRNFSRLDEAKLKKVSLREGIENTLKLLSGELKNRIRVHTDFGPTPEALCYASQLNQVFMNILSNAAQAIESEGEIWITLRHLPETQCAQINIKDSGKGMPPEVLEKVFDPFFTTKGVGQGTGLGLSISYGIIKQHGGDIQVQSEPGKGTEFIITIPLEAT